MREKKARVKITLNDIEKGLEQNVLGVQGKAYFFLEYILLIRNDADDWSGVRLRERSEDELTKHHIFPREFLLENLNLDETEIGESHIDNLGNITLIHKDVNSEIGDSPPSEYLPQYSASLEAHFIPSDRNLWTIEQYTTFLEYRVRQIYRSARQHFANIVE